MRRAREEQERDLCGGLISIELIEGGGDDEMNSMAFQLPATSPGDSGAHWEAIL